MKGYISKAQLDKLVAQVKTRDIYTHERKCLSAQDDNDDSWYRPLKIMQADMEHEGFTRVPGVDIVFTKPVIKPFDYEQFQFIVDWLDRSPWKHSITKDSKQVVVEFG